LISLFFSLAIPLLSFTNSLIRFTRSSLIARTHAGDFTFLSAAEAVKRLSLLRLLASPAARCSRRSGVRWCGPQCRGGAVARDRVRALRHTSPTPCSRNYSMSMRSGDATSRSSCACTSDRSAISSFGRPDSCALAYLLWFHRRRVVAGDGSAPGACSTPAQFFRRGVEIEAAPSLRKWVTECAPKCEFAGK
jgi:hypothetical protein